MADFLMWEDMDVCDDCYYIVNMEFPDSWTDEEKEAWNVAVSAEIPEGYVMVAFSCDEDDEEWGCETHFSNSHCELCGALPGDRHTGTLVLDRKEN